MTIKYVIFIDGSGWNGFRSLAGIEIQGDNGELILRDVKSFPIKYTNNQMEYEALLMALREADDVTDAEFEIRTDSALVYHQAFVRDWEVKNYHLIKRYEEAQQILNRCNTIKTPQRVIVKWVPRKENVIGRFIDKLPRQWQRKEGYENRSGNE